MGCFFCLMKERNPSKNRASILKFFRELSTQDADDQTLSVSGLCNTTMTHPNDPQFVELGRFECVVVLILLYYSSCSSFSLGGILARSSLELVYFTFLSICL